LVKRFNDVYVSENMILCVVGDADFDTLCSFAEKAFMKKKGIVKKFDIKEKNSSNVEKRKGIDQVNFVFAYHSPKAGNSLAHTSEVLIAVLGEGMSSRLFTEIREKRNLAYVVKGASASHKTYAYNIIYAGTTKESMDEVKRLILEEFGKVSKDLDEKELSEVKEQLIGNYHISMEDSTGQLGHLLLHEVDGNVDDFYDYEKKIRAVKLEDVKKLAKIKDYSFFALVPE
jgi:predicted Zn-dependent peptidase